MIDDHDRYTQTMLDAQADMVAALDAGRASEAVSAVCDDLLYAWKGATYTRGGTVRGSREWQRRKQFAASCWIAAQKLGGVHDTR